MDASYQIMLLEDLIRQETIIKKRFTLYEHQLLILEIISNELSKIRSHSLSNDLLSKIRYIDKYLDTDINNLLIILVELIREQSV